MSVRTKTYPDGWVRRIEDSAYRGGLRYTHLDRPDGRPFGIWLTRFPHLRASLAWRRHSPCGRWNTATLASFAALTPAGFGSNVLPGPIVLAAFAIFVPLAIFSTFKELRHGRHRQAQADHRDPRDQTGTQGGAGGTTQGASTGLIASLPPTAQSFLAGMAPWQQNIYNQFLASFDGEIFAELDTVEDDIPILAHRWAFLDFGTRQFKSLNGSHHGHFGTHATAACQRTRLFAYDIGTSPEPHPAPDPGCTCGFYAVPADQLPAWKNANGTVELEVQLSGRVIEHERGYRAQHQTVLAAVAPACVCGKASVRAWVGGRDGSARGIVAWDCGSHDVVHGGDEMAFALTLDQLSETFDVPFKAAT